MLLDVVPWSAFYLRNIIMSAFPNSIHQVPDPLTFKSAQISFSDDSYPWVGIISIEYEPHFHSLMSSYVESQTPVSFPDYIAKQFSKDTVDRMLSVIANMVLHFITHHVVERSDSIDLVSVAQDPTYSIIRTIVLSSNSEGNISTLLFCSIQSVSFFQFYIGFLA